VYERNGERVIAEQPMTAEEGTGGTDDAGALALGIAALGDLKKRQEFRVNWRDK